MANDIEKAIEALITVKKDAMLARVERGLKRREQLSMMIAAGLVPEGNARYDWLTSSIGSLIDHLAQRAATFNDANPDDAISVHDMHDALVSAARTLVSEAKRLTQTPT